MPRCPKMQKHCKRGFKSLGTGRKQPRGGYLTTSRWRAMIVNTFLATGNPMARNKLAGSTSGKGRTARHYHNNEESRKKKQAYDKKYHATAERKAYRSELNTARRKAKPAKGQDMSHTKSGRLVKESRSTNRARNRSRKA